MECPSMWIRIDRPFAIPAEIRKVLQVLSQQGHEAYLVGGAVRDFIRNQTVKDFDIATSAEPDQVMALFSKVIEVGKAFGVLKVVSDSGQEIEVATFRKEGGYVDHRHPKNIQFSSLEFDSDRRDFTINALYYDIKTHQIYDRHQGLEDIKNKKIKAIGDPVTRFQEDALRLMRALRFSSRFGFGIEEQTYHALRECSPLIRKMSVERVNAELIQILKSPQPKQAFLDLENTGLLPGVLPEIAGAILHQKKVSEQTARSLFALSKYEQQEPDAFYWAMLLMPSLRIHPVELREQEAKKISERMKFSNETLELLTYLIRETPKFRDSFSMREATLIRWMRDPKFEILLRFHSVEAMAFDGNLAGYEFVKTIYQELKQKIHLATLITGEDLNRLGMKPGRHYAEILRAVDDLALEGKLTTHDEAMEYVLQNFVE